MQIQTKLPSKGKLDPKAVVDQSVSKPVSQLPPNDTPSLQQSPSTAKLQALKQSTKNAVVTPPRKTTPSTSLPLYHPKPQRFVLDDSFKQPDSSSLDPSHIPSEEVSTPPVKNNFFSNSLNKISGHTKKSSKPWVQNKNAASNPSDLEELFFANN